MAESALKRVERMLPGKPICPFDFFNDKLFYDPQLLGKSEYTARLNAQPVVAYAAVNAVTRGVKTWFGPGAMSNGELAYELVEKSSDKVRRSVVLRTGHDALTTQRLKHMVAGKELFTGVIIKNRVQNSALNGIAMGLRDGFGVMGVIGPEGAWRSTRNDNALSQGATFQDVIFERWWGPRVLDSAGMVLYGDHAYSRYANVEEVLGDQIQCGLLDDYRKHIGPGKEYDIVDDKGQPVPLADRAWETAKHIVDVVERGFITDLGVAALVARFQIDDWLRSKHDATPLDRRKLHPVLAKRDPEELARMDRLKDIMLPYLSAKCTAWMPYAKHPQLGAYFENNILPLSSDIDSDTVSALKAELFSYQPKGGFVHTKPDYRVSTAQDDRATARLAFAAHASRPSALRDERYFAPRSDLFDDYHFGRLSLWEQAGLKFILPVMESVDLPANTPKRFMYLCDPKSGPRATAWAEKHNLSWLKEAQNVEDQTTKHGFVKDVVVPNEKEGCKNLDDLNANELLKRHGVGNVYGTLDLLDIRQAVVENREFVAAQGAARYSARAHLALQMEFLNRNAEGIILGPDWQNHPHHVQLVVEAVKNAVGLVDRGYDGGKYKMEFLEYHPEASGVDQFRKLDLYDLIKTLARTVEGYLDQTPPVPDRAAYVACARLLEISDKLVDPGNTNYRIITDKHTGQSISQEIIDWRQVDTAFRRFVYDNPSKAADLSAAVPGAAPTLRDRVRTKIMANITELGFEPSDLEGLSPDYEAAWVKAYGHDALNRYRKTKHDGRHLIVDSPT